MAGVPPKEPDHDRELRERLELSQDELRVLQQCNVESFWYRSFPFAIGLSVLAHLGIQKGYWRGSPRFGSTPKVLLATLVGYIAGKFSYRDKCAEMIMELPNSRIAETLRRNQQNAGRPPIPNEELSVPVYSEPTSKQIASRRARDGSVRDLDDYRKPDLDCKLSVPVYSEPTSEQIASRRARDGSVRDLDDYRKPDLDLSSFQERPPEASMMKEEENQSKDVQGLSYDELRRRNRSEFETKKYEQMKRDVTGPLASSAAPDPEKPKKGRTTNAYGDEWEK
ncbi:unnamed protein product [Notodromas monacha]|uniref:OCIA domain-containing protein n=1 Tax=Notodromas monacha TaxID=399045 RepID=A0A7R9BSU5_9CRUS|nr:unnamed protein product [Notodromas monacha]CAG0919716.1 unnamed protein product [Notodromas monacha]